MNGRGVVVCSKDPGASKTTSEHGHRWGIPVVLLNSTCAIYVLRTSVVTVRPKTPFDVGRGNFNRTDHSSMDSG